MAVRYLPIDGEIVSAEWMTALASCRRSGVVFRVNEGKRTFAKQQYFRTLYLQGRGALAAIPSHTAPHIRTGRFDHALDLNNAAGVMGWLRRNGIGCALTVPGESWHVEANASDLAAYHRRHGRTAARTIRKGSRPGKDIAGLQVLLRQAGYLRSSWRAHRKYTLTVRRAVRAAQRDLGLTVDGVVGPRTLAKLKGAARARR